MALKDNVPGPLAQVLPQLAILCDAIEAGTIAAGPITTSGLTVSTGKLLGRTSASTGAIEEIVVGTGLLLASTTLSVGPRIVLTTVTAPIVISASGQTYATYSGADESGPALFINRSVASEATANEHGIVDATQFARSTKAYGSFDAQPVFTGTNSYDHYAGFQSRGDHASTGTLTNYFSFLSIPNRSGSGTITNLYAFYAGVGGAGSGAATNRYSFVSESNAGNAGIGTITPNHRLTVGENETPIGTSAIVGIYNAANCYGIYRDTTANIEAVIGTDGTGSFVGSHSNHRLVLVTNNATRLMITSGGQVVIGTGSATTSSAFEIQSTTGAFMPPKMTTTQKNALTASEGMVVMDTTLHELHVYNGTAWGRP